MLIQKIILSSAESYFLQAEAVVRGLGNGDAQALMAAGIKEAMKLWGVSGGDADTYIASAPLADINSGSMDEQLEKNCLATMDRKLYRWVLKLGLLSGKTGYPSDLAAGVAGNPIIFAQGTLNGQYPQRMRLWPREHR